MSRVGKIARLPKAVREQLNRRLDDGEEGKKLVRWLNSLEEVRAVMAADFQGVPVSQSNLSEWKQGGLVDWQRQQAVVAVASHLAEDANAFTEATEGALTDKLAAWLSARVMVLATAVVNCEGEPDRKWKLLHELCADLVELREGDHRVRRIELERQRLFDAKVAQFTVWFKNEKARQIMQSPGSNADKIAALHTAYFADIHELEKSGKVKLPQ